MSTAELVFVTGASGFVGSHVVDALLDAKYRVRVAVRGAKVEKLKALYGADPDCKDLVEVVEVPDIATHDFTHDFKGVSALIHTAASVPAKANADTMVKDAIEGTMNIIRQAQRVGIKRIVYTSSVATVLNPENIWANDRWNNITKEDAFASNDELDPYRYGKTVAEQELWKFADEHPDLDVTSLLPPYIYGPRAKHFIVDFMNVANLSTAASFGRMLNPDTQAYPIAYYIDVRDLAKAHVLSLRSPTGLGRKRLVIMAEPQGLDFSAAQEILVAERPSLKDRLIKLPPSSVWPSVQPDQDRIEQVLGIKVADFMPMKKTLLDSVDSLLEVEQQWVAEGAKMEDIMKEYLTVV